MEKLIKLHKEFVHNNKEYTTIYYNNKYKCFCFDCCDSFYDFTDGAIQLLISKEYGFVKWLCERDKIDYKKDDYGMVIYREGNLVYLESYKEVLMELAIQEKPIEFLISILK